MENIFNISYLEFSKEKIVNIVKSLELPSEFSVCFSGNRPLNLPWKNNENCDICLSFKSNVKFLLESLIEKGANKFICGMAMGFDIMMAELVLELKEKYNVELVGAIPCINQSDNWGFAYKRRYDEVFSKLDKVIYVSNSTYFNGCFHIRNHYMVNNSNLLLAGSFASSGGTIQTIAYANKKGKSMIVIGN